MENIEYPGMQGPAEVVGEYYSREGTRIVTNGRTELYFRGDGHIQLRDRETGRFISEQSALEILAKQD